MKYAPVQIRNDAVVRDIRELSALTGKPITEAVARAVGSELERAKLAKAEDRERILQEVREITQRLQALPVVGPMLTDDDLYDEDGMPR